MNKRIRKKMLMKSDAHRLNRHFHIRKKDTWNCDDTIAQFIADLLSKFHKYNQCYPGNDKYPTFESWQDKIKSIADRCKAYAEFDDVGKVEKETAEKTIDDYIAALHDLAEDAPHIWW